jgi:hypothetical protein
VTQTTTTTPPGFRKDAKGRLIPESQIKPIDLERDKLVLDLVERAKVVSQHIVDFKAGAFGDIAAFVQLSAEEYGARIGGDKGNVQLMSFDGRYKVLRAIQERLVFDERLQAAKALVDECIHAWSEGARPEIRALVTDAFQTDKAGAINTGRVLGLRRLNIVDAKWQQAMAALSDAVTVADSKSYIRVYERVGDTEEYRPIPLDVAGA